MTDDDVAERPTYTASEVIVARVEQLGVARAFGERFPDAPRAQPALEPVG